MAITREDLGQLMRLLREDPGARGELQQMVVPPELDALRAAISALADAQRRTEARVAELAEAQGRTEARVAELAEAQARTEERLGRLEAAVMALVEAQRRMEERLDRLEATVAALAAAQLRTEEAVRRLVDVTGELKGEMMEIQYERKAGAYFGPLLRRVRVVPHHEVADQLESALSPEELNDVLLLDLFVTGQPRQPTEVGAVWLAVEVSSVVDSGDVHRAVRRARLLRRAGLTAIPVVAGGRVLPEAEAEAAAEPVVSLTDGRREHWSEALTAYAAD